jgi:hypothetical protein
VPSSVLSFFSAIKPGMVSTLLDAGITDGFLGGFGAVAVWGRGAAPAGAAAVLAGRETPSFSLSFAMRSRKQVTVFL